MLGHPSDEGALDALLAGRKLIKAKRSADEIIEGAGGLVEGFTQRGFVEPELGRVELVSEFLPLVLGDFLAREHLADNRVRLTKFFDAADPLVLISLAVNLQSIGADDYQLALAELIFERAFLNDFELTGRWWPWWRRRADNRSFRFGPRVVRLGRGDHLSFLAGDIARRDHRSWQCC